MAETRLVYIRTLLETVYTYNHQPQLLLERLKTEMSVKKMLCYHVIEDTTHTCIPPDRKIRKDDELLFLLHEAGFSPKELCVMFNLNNLNSVYVKCHRVHKKLDPPEEANAS